jgi:hypothetical protein
MKQVYDDYVYFLYRRGRKIRVTKEEWERSWLDWYMMADRSH